MSTVKVGDELAFRGCYGREWSIFKVTGITPTGRIKCGHYTLDPNLRIRGPQKWGPYEAKSVTPEIREASDRADMLEVLQRKARSMAALTTDQLRRIVAILDEGAANGT